MESTNQSGWTSIVSGSLCFLGCIAAGISLTRVVGHLNAWQAVGYAVVAGIFIACFTVIINTMLKTLAQD